MIRRITSSGFSLLEILIVLAITCLLCGLISFNLSFVHSAQAHQEINLLYARMGALQQTAIATAQNQILQFIPHEHAYWWENKLYRLPKSVRFQVLSTLKGPPSTPHETPSSAVTFPNHRITFYPDGIIQAGTVYLLNDKQQQYALSCGVSTVSFLRKYRYDGIWKIIE